MTTAQILLRLWKRRIWVALCGVLAAAAAVASLTLGHSRVYASASTQMIVDSPQSALADARTDLTGYVARAVVFARLMTAPEALQYIGKAAGVPGNLIAAAGPVELAGPNATHSPSAVQGGHLTSALPRYKLDFLQNPELPTVDVYSEAPTTTQAIALANGAVSGFGAYIAQLEARGAIPVGHRIEVRQLGGATGGVVDPGASKSTAVLVFVASFVLLCGAILLLDNFRGQLRAAKAKDAKGGAPAYAAAEEPGSPAPAHQFPLLRHRAVMRDDGVHSNGTMNGGTSEAGHPRTHARDHREEEEVRRELHLGS